MIHDRAAFRLCLRLVVGVTCGAAAMSQTLADDFKIALLDGSIIRGDLAEVVPRIKLVTAGDTISLDWTDILSITPPAADARRAADGPDLWRFTLTDGSLFHGSVIGTTEDDFIVQFGPQRTCRLSLDALTSITAASPSGAAGAKIAEIARDTQRTVDYVVIARNDSASVLRGAVSRIAREHVVVDWNRRTVRVPWPRLAAIFFAAAPPRSSSSRVFMTSGEVFAGRVRSGTAVSITLQSSVFDNLVLPWNRIDRIECISDRLRFLSDLRPSGYEFEPFFEKSWDYSLDKSLSGQPIRLGGQTYARGVCMHSQAALTYRIGGQYRQLAFVAGILDEMQERGSVTMRVLGDGRQLWQLENVRGGQKPVPAIVSVAGVHELTLAVDFGEDLDLSDHACWAFARLIR